MYIQLPALLLFFSLGLCAPSKIQLHERKMRGNLNPDEADAVVKRFSDFCNSDGLKGDYQVSPDKDYDTKFACTPMPDQKLNILFQVGMSNIYNGDATDKPVTRTFDPNRCLEGLNRAVEVAGGAQFMGSVYGLDKGSPIGMSYTLYFHDSEVPCETMLSDPFKYIRADPNPTPTPTPTPAS